MLFPGRLDRRRLPSGRAYRRLCSAVQAVLQVWSQWPTRHTERRPRDRHGPASAVVSALAWQTCWISLPGPVEDVHVDGAILPGDAQESSEATQVEAVEPAFLTGVEGLCFASIEKSTQHTRLVHFHLGVGRQHGVAPNSLCETSHRCCCLANAHVQLGIQKEVAGDVGAQVGEVLDDPKGVVADGDLRSAADVLAHEIGLFQADGEAALSSGVSEAGDKPL